VPIPPQPAILFLGPDPGPDLPPGWSGAASALECLHRATSGQVRGVVADLRGLDLEQMRSSLELCRLLGENPHTRGLPRAALLPEVLREVLEELDRSGVDAAHLAGAAPAPGLDPGVRDAAFAGPRPADLLRTTCPFFDSRPAGKGWLHCCGAYRDRLVLGGRRMAVYCLGDGFRDCPYFNSPRPPKPQGAQP
jgi:hypothetical protein